MSLESLFSKIFAGKDGAEEKQHLHAWKEEYKDNLDGLNALKDIWNQSDDLKEYQSFDQSKAFENFKGRINETRPASVRTIGKNVYRYAAVGLFVVCFGFILSFYNNDGVHRLSANTNTRNVLLPDGTSVTLFKGSNLSYSNDFITDRKLRLEGDAFFKVMPDAVHPFHIETKQANIQVLGTSFLIREFQAFTNVGVAEGKVRVSNELHEAVLQAGEKIEITEKTIRPVSWESTDEDMIPDFIMAQEESVDKLLASVFKGSELSYTFRYGVPDCQINAFFYNQEIADIIQEISLICGFSYLQEAEIFVIE